MKTYKTSDTAAAFPRAARLTALSDGVGMEVLNEGFGNVAGLHGWEQKNLSPSAGIGWFQGNADVFPSRAGARQDYIAANFLGALDGKGRVDNWLITPVLDLSGTTMLSFFTSRGTEPGFFDTLELRFARGNDSRPEAFSMLLATISGPAYPTAWQQFCASVDVTGPGRFAFRYVGDAASLNYIGLDTVRVVTAVPKPSLYQRLALGLRRLTLFCRNAVK
jgi:hypothetical protein